jgi:hypothetical protein
MSANGIVKHYGRLTPGERFRLILAAGARGDKVEQARLTAAGKCILLEVQDHAPFAIAFGELSMITFIELLEVAADYLDSLREAGLLEGAAVEIEDEPLDLALAAGFLLRTKADGWRLFCERLSVPAFAEWELLPGFERLQAALGLAEKAAFTRAGVARWLNGIPPEGEPQVTEEGMLSADSFADDLEAAFHRRVEWWGG